MAVKRRDRDARLKQPGAPVLTDDQRTVVILRFFEGRPVADVRAYINNQQAHHARLSFEEEFVAFLRRHGLPYDEKYVLG